MSRHRHQQVRPRYGRISVAASSVAVTAIAVLGGVGALPSAADPPAAAGKGAISQVAADSRDQTAADPRATTGIPSTADSQEARTAPPQDALPEGSGAGRRVVYSEGAQRVWLVSKGSEVLRTYPVSGSVYDNLDPGSYIVYSRSEQAWGIDDSGTMKYFVRFTQGDNAAIGFHDIPIDDGARVQTVDQLGTPLSHGCIRQKRSDAKVLWEFAPIGTTVVVTA